MEARHADQICHPGVVEAIEGRKLTVRIESQSACGHCRAKSYCGMVETTGKHIEVFSDRPESFAEGQQVEVLLQRSLGYRALLMGYMLPFLILLLSLFGMYYLSGNEGLSALVAILLMLPYYALLYRHRDKLRKTFHFSVRPVAPGG